MSPTAAATLAAAADSASEASECESGGLLRRLASSSGATAAPHKCRGGRRLLRKAPLVLVLAGAAVLVATSLGGLWGRPPGPPAGGRLQTIRAASDLGDHEVTLQLIARDFIRHSDSGGHPDFEGEPSKDPEQATTPVVESQLGADGRPVWREPALQGFTSKERFDQWYRNVDGVNKQVVLDITMEESETSNTYVFDRDDFFPLDGLGFKDQREENGHNYYFTVELHHSFVYHGGEQFSFRGDDDLWVFINNTLAIDLGGMHLPLSGAVSLDEISPPLTKGSLAALDLFFAERRYSGSNFRIETTIDLGEDPCATFDLIDLTGVAQSNLGGKGPSTGVGEGLVFDALEKEPAKDPVVVQLRVHVKEGSNYEPEDPALNGLHLKYGAVNIRAGTEVTLLISLVDAAGQPMHVPKAEFSFFDLDTAPDGSAAEYLTLSGFHKSYRMDKSEVVETLLPDGRVQFKGSKPGTAGDNPANPSILTNEQKNRAVTFEFIDFTEMEVTFGTLAGTGGRTFLFVGRPSLLCAATQGTGDEDNQVVTVPAPTLTSAGSRCCCVIEMFNFICFEEKQWWTFWCPSSCG